MKKSPIIKTCLQIITLISTTRVAISLIKNEHTGLKGVLKNYGPAFLSDFATDAIAKTITALSLVGITAGVYNEHHESIEEGHTKISGYMKSFFE